MMTCSVFISWFGGATPYQIKKPRLTSGLFFALQLLLIMYPVVLSSPSEFILHFVLCKNSSAVYGVFFISGVQKKDVLEDKVVKTAEICGFQRSVLTTKNDVLRLANYV